MSKRKRSRVFRDGDIASCPRKNLPKLPEGFFWERYADDGYAWKAREIQPTTLEEKVPFTQLELRSRGSGNRERD